MALKVGMKAPDFSLLSTSGNTFRLSQDQANKPCIIYFYPKDFTSVCTKEACEFRDAFAQFREVEVDVLGISRDDVASHLEFKKAHRLPFELLSDTDGQVAKAYGATIPFVKFTRRITYLLDKEHRIAAVYENLFNADNHIKMMIEKINGETAAG